MEKGMREEEEEEEEEESRKFLAPARKEKRGEEEEVIGDHSVERGPKGAGSDGRDRGLLLGVT